jgi:hypothetical protein
MSGRPIAGFLLMFLGLSVNAVSAEVIWRGDFETGDTKQWKGAPRDGVTIVQDPVRAGKYALRIDGTNAARKGKHDRIELQHQPEPPGTAEGAERYFGWSVYLPRKLTDANHSLGYFETRNSWSQLMAFEVKGEDILFTTRVPYTRHWSGKGKLTAGKWHDFAVHVLWSRDPGKGFVEVWFDGEKVVPLTRTATLRDENVAFFQIGLFRETSDVPETIILDHVIEATTLEDVTPPRSGEPSKKEEATELGKLAAAMKPGTWAELKTEGYTAELLKVQNHHILEYTAAATWDPTSQQVLFVGQGHYSAVKFISYAAKANAWTLRPTPSWWKGDAETGKGPIGHAYYNNAIDPAKGVFYLHQSATRLVHRYEIAKDEWTTLPEIKDAATGHGTALVWFPERKGLVRVLGGTVHFFNDEKKEWTLLKDRVPMGPYHNVAQYSAAHKVVLFGGGNNSKDLYRLDAAGAITACKTAPFEVGINTAVVTSDPVSGDFLVLHKDDKFYSYNPKTDTWKELATEGMPFAMKGSSFDVVATPVADHGVTLFFTAQRKGLNVVLYKHAPGS